MADCWWNQLHIRSVFVLFSKYDENDKTSIALSMTHMIRSVDKFPEKGIFEQLYCSVTGVKELVELFDEASFSLGVYFR